MSGSLLAAGGASIVGRLLGSGLERVGSLVFQKAARVHKIDKALRLATARSPIVTAAISDLEVVLGSRYGELTEQLHEFLNEIEKSGIANLLVENAIVARTSPELKKLFCELHARTVGIQAGDPSQLYDRIQRSIEVTVSELCKDRVLLEAIRIYRKEAEERLERIEHSIADINTHYDSSRFKLSHTDFTSLLIRAARAIQTANRHIRIETNKGARFVDLTKIYIPSSLRYREMVGDNGIFTNLRKIIELGKTKEKASTSSLTVGASEDITRFTYKELRAQFHRTVILGDPGGGKSTLCQYLCFDFAKQFVAGIQNQSSNISAQLQKCPIRVILRAYERARVQEHQLSLYENITRDLTNYLTSDRDEIRIILDYLLSTGSAILAFDGLDEILATARRREFVDLVLAFCNQYPLCPVIVTSRFVGYDVAPLSSDFDELILDKFSDQQIISYTVKFMRVVAGQAEKEAKRSADKFFEQTTRNASDLRRNPLMLGLMAWLFNALREIPSNRPEIYRECATLMFERWDPNRDIKSDIPSDFDTLQLFSDLASKIYGIPELSAGVEEPWLEGRVREFFEALYENKARAIQSARSLVKFITGRAWVMSEVGGGVFAFTHQTFLEYFFARHLNDLHDSVESLFNYILPKIVQREWDVVSHLALQIKTYRNLRRQNEAIDLLTGAIRGQNDSKIRTSIASFSARALEYLAGAEPNVKGLVALVFQQTIADTSEQVPSAALLQCCNCSIERRVFVREALTQIVVDRFTTDPTLFADLISYRGSVRRLPTEVIGEVQRRLERYVKERVEQSAFFAVKAWEWYGHISQSLVSKFGLPPYHGATIESNLGELDGFSTVILSASSEYGFHFSKSVISTQKALEALSIFGTIGFSSPPFQRMDFRKNHLPTAPLGVLGDLVSSFTRNPSSMVGALYCLLVLADLSGRDLPTDPILKWVFTQSSVQKLPIFPKIKRFVDTYMQDGFTNRSAEIMDD
jgi:hypothetical protein